MPKPCWSENCDIDWVVPIVACHVNRAMPSVTGNPAVNARVVVVVVVTVVTTVVTVSVRGNRNHPQTNQHQCDHGSTNQSVSHDDLTSKDTGMGEK